VPPDAHEVLRIGLVGDPRLLEEAKVRFLVRADRARILGRRADHALIDVVLRENDVTQECPDQPRSVTLSDLRQLPDEQVDARGRRLQRERGGVRAVVADPVALDEADGAFRDDG
jgi:hypothetical protein